MTKAQALKRANQYLDWALKAKAKSRAVMDTLSREFKDFDFTEPIKLGHHSQRRHERKFERRDSLMRQSIEWDAKAKRYAEKAMNLEMFANTHKGDAERKRQTVREQNDALIKVGSIIVDYCYGRGEVLRVNTKTYSIAFMNGMKTTRDKSFIKTPV